MPVACLILFAYSSKEYGVRNVYSICLDHKLCPWVTCLVLLPKEDVWFIEHVHPSSSSSKSPGAKETLHVPIDIVYRCTVMYTVCSMFFHLCIYFE